jgi:hypothetical protein
MEKQTDQIRLGILFQIVLRLWPEDAGNLFMPEYADSLYPYEDHYEEQKRILDEKIDPYFAAALHILHRGEDRMEFFQNEAQRRANNAKLMKGELVKYTEAVKLVTGHNGKYYKDRFGEAVANNEKYNELVLFMKKKGFPKALIPYFQEEYPKHIEQMRRFTHRRPKKPDDPTLVKPASDKKPAKRARKKS